MPEISNLSHVVGSDMLFHFHSSAYVRHCPFTLQVTTQVTYGATHAEWKWRGAWHSSQAQLSVSAVVVVDYLFIFSFNSATQWFHQTYNKFITNQTCTFCKAVCVPRIPSQKNEKWRSHRNSRLPGYTFSLQVYVNFWLQLYITGM